MLFIVKNYPGDMMNFQMAAEMLDRDSATVIINADVAAEDFTYTTGRPGVAGTLIVERIDGAAAERGESLAELKALGNAVNKGTASMGVALTSCTVPAAGQPTFQIGPDGVEMGVGIHGEPGRRRVKLGSADDIAAELAGSVLEDLSLARGQEVILLVNGGGLALGVLRHGTASLYRRWGDAAVAGSGDGRSLGARASSAQGHGTGHQRLACRALSPQHKQ